MRRLHRRHPGSRSGVHLEASRSNQHLEADGSRRGCKEEGGRRGWGAGWVRGYWARAAARVGRGLGASAGVRETCNARCHRRRWRLGLSADRPLGLPALSLGAGGAGRFGGAVLLAGDGMPRPVAAIGRSAHPTRHGGKPCDLAGDGKHEESAHREASLYARSSSVLLHHSAFGHRKATGGRELQYTPAKKIHSRTKLNPFNDHEQRTHTTLVRSRRPLRGSRALRKRGQSTRHCGLHAPPSASRPKKEQGPLNPPAGRRGYLPPSRQPSFQPLPLTDARLSGYDTPAGAIASTSICISCSSRAAASCRTVSATCACDHR